VKVGSTRRLPSGLPRMAARVATRQLSIGGSIFFANRSAPLPHSSPSPRGTRAPPAHSCPSPLKTRASPAHSCPSPLGTRAAPAHSRTSQALRHTQEADACTPPLDRSTACRLPSTTPTRNHFSGVKTSRSEASSSLWSLRCRPGGNCCSPSRWMNRSSAQGIPSCRTPPPLLGISCLRTGFGW
jgi:hypothetical protein